MSDINDKATITLNVNGQQAKRMIDEIEKSVSRAEQKLVSMQKVGADPVAIKKQSKVVKDLKRDLDNMKKSVDAVNSVMVNLDKATPRQLEKSLKQMKKQLKDLEPGTEVWKQHTKKITELNKRLTMLNSQLKEQQPLWTRIKNSLNDNVAAIAMLIMGYTQLINGMRKYVGDYADMEESVWNTVKYTRMEREEVDQLQKSFKKWDTRLFRKDLNTLAQEAGRLGKNTIKDVSEYVEAAQIINVALEDLGRGATQEIAKIANIFGVEELYGVRDAMLKVGSTVNHLSQNCTASKPYLVEYTKRLAGIGATSKMTIPEILAFGAVLDANGQKCEMSASAISRLVMMLFQNPGEIAKKVGLDVEKFTAILNNNTTQGLITFLERLKELSGGNESLAVATLAPMFKDLGMDGIRMSQVIATLSQHLGELNWQIGEANRAFEEGKSATNEFEIFNNTELAKIEKGKNRIKELTIELGQKLSPLMVHFMSTSSAAIKVLNVLVDFIKKYGSEILVVATSILFYEAAVRRAVIIEKLHAAQIAVSSAASIAAKAATYLWAAAINLLSGNLRKARMSMSLFNATLKTNPIGLVISLVTTAITAIMLFKKRTDEAAKAQKDLNREINQAASAISAEKKAVEKAFDALRKAKKGSEEYQAAKDEIINKYGSYLSGLINEKNELIDIEAAYYRVANAARKAAIERGMQASKRIVEDEFSEKDASLFEKLQSKLEKYVIDGANVPAIMELVRREISEKGAFYSADAITSSIKKGQKENSWDAIYGIIVEIEQNYKSFEKKNKEIEQKLGYSENEYVNFDIDTLGIMEADLKSQLQDKAKSYDILAGGRYISQGLSRSEAYLALDKIQEAIRLSSGKAKSQASEEIQYTPEAEPLSGKDRFKEIEDWRTKEEALLRISYATGKKNYIDFTNEMAQVEIDYYEKILKRSDLSESERLDFEAKLWEKRKSITEDGFKKQAEKEVDRFENRKYWINQYYVNGFITKEERDEEFERMEIEHQNNLIAIHKKGSKERRKAELNLQSLLIKDKEKKAKELEDAEKRLQAELDKIKKAVFGNNEAENKEAYEHELENLTKVYEAEIEAVEDNTAEKLRIEEAFNNARIALLKEYNLYVEEENKSLLERLADKYKSWAESDSGKAIKGASDTLISGMSAIFSQYSSLISAEMNLQSAKIEERYKKEIDLAEGNSYRVAKLEKDKEKEIAKVKSEANRKMFSMQVIQAIAQTAQNALNAYGSAAAIPVVGHIIAPIAAAMAVTAGMMQVAAIKKQQQQADAQGYAEGGFTKPGRKYDEAGIVHAGEWVASQELVSNPSVRPFLDTFEAMQRSGRAGYLNPYYVSRERKANIIGSNDNSGSWAMLASNIKESSSLIDKLNKRLSDPFVTVNTMSGDYGIDQAQSEYKRYRRSAANKKNRLKWK